MAVCHGERTKTVNQAARTSVIATLAFIRVLQLCDPGDWTLRPRGQKQCKQKRENNEGRVGRRGKNNVSQKEKEEEEEEEEEQSTRARE